MTAILPDVEYVRRAMESGAQIPMPRTRAHTRVADWPVLRQDAESVWG